VEHHPLDRDARLEGLQQVPGDGLALAVTVRREVELVDVLEQALEFGDGGLLLGADDVEGSKSWSTLTPRRAQGSDLYLAGTSAAARGRSRMCPRDDSTM
jgi:hypothetical protein